MISVLTWTNVESGALRRTIKLRVLADAFVANGALRLQSCKVHETDGTVDSDGDERLQPSKAKPPIVSQNNPRQSKCSDQD